MYCTVPDDDPGLNSGNVTILYDVQEMSFNIVSLRNLPNSIQNTPNSAYMDFGYMVFLSDFFDYKDYVPNKLCLSPIT